MSEIYIVTSNDDKYSECLKLCIEKYSHKPFLKFITHSKLLSKIDSTNSNDIKFVLLNGKEFLKHYPKSTLGKVFSINGVSHSIIDKINFYELSDNIDTLLEIFENLQKNKNVIHSIKIPDKFYTEEYVLINIQYMKPSDKILYIFRNSENEVEYHYEPLNKFYYYYSSESKSASEVFETYSNLDLKFNKTLKSEKTFGSYYEEDLKIELRHSIDYYFNRSVKERPYEPLVLYWDIEVFSDMNREFPNPLKALKPINAISFKMSNSTKTNVYIFKNERMDKSPIKEISDVDVRVFESESEMLQQFCKFVKTSQPDMLSGWNTSTFDVPYIFNRMYNLKIDYDQISPVNETYVALNEFFRTHVYGLYFMDQLNLYKKMNSGKQEPSYKLSYIANKILGKGKVAYEGLLDSVYINDINKFIEYSYTDTKLLNELEDQLKHIMQKFELIKVCATTFEKSETTSGLVEPNALLFAKRRGIVCKNRGDRPKREKFSGAYVIAPKRGLYKWVIDLDFKALYPSIICSFNVGHNTYMSKVSKDIAAKYIYDRDSLPDKISILHDPINEDSKYLEISKSEFEDYIESDKKIVAVSGCIFKNHNIEKSFLYELLMNLMKMRDDYKKKLGNEREMVSKISDKSDTNIFYATACKNIKQYDTIQVAYKILMNSFYGAIANPYFRLYNLDMAKTITSCGQEVLKYSVTHVSNYLCTGSVEMDRKYLKRFQSLKNKYIIYGDTDSMFVAVGDYMKTLKN